MAQYRDHIEEALFERIEAYLLNTMDASARAAFERELEASETLRNEVDLQRRLTAAVEIFSDAGEQQYRDPVVVKKASHIIWYAAAAVAAILITWFYLNNSAPSPDKIYARYFIPDAGLPVVMSSVNENYDFYDGMISYKEEDYNKAIEIWKNIYRENATNDTVQYFIGVAYLNNNDRNAIDYLLPVAENDNSRWQSKAIWYLALAYVKYGRKEEAVTWLKKLNGDERAIQLEKDIEKISP